MDGATTTLGILRGKRGLSAIELAAKCGVKRQTIYAIESGAYIPNTAVALRLARALETTVEELFTLADDSPEPGLLARQATLIPGSTPPVPGQAVQLCQVDKQLMASLPSPVPWYLPATDAVVAEKPRREGHTSVQVFSPESQYERVLVAGCDPAISVLARHVQPAGIETVLVHRNSSQSLLLLKQGGIHIAGTHLKDERTGESNLPEIGRIFPKRAVSVVSFAVWEEGIVTARGNPKTIRGVEDLARKDVCMVNREPGAGSRVLLDSQLARLGMAATRPRGYNDTAPGHLPAAWQVYSGAVDCCIATHTAARAFGLHFIPLATERYDLVIRRKHMALPRIQNLLDILTRLSFRRELEALGGYDTTVAGRRIV